MLDTQVSLIALSQTVAAGVATQVETVQDTPWARFEGIGGTMLGLTMEADYRITLSYRTDINPRWLIGVGTRRFKITRPAQDPDGKQERTVLYANEVLA